MYRTRRVFTYLAAVTAAVELLAAVTAADGEEETARRTDEEDEEDKEVNDGEDAVRCSMSRCAWSKL